MAFGFIFVRNFLASILLLGFAGSAHAHDVTSIFVKLFVAPEAVVANPTDKVLNMAWQNGTLHPARGTIYFQLKDTAGQVIDQGKLSISKQGRLKSLSAAEVKKASSVYVGTESFGKIWQLADGTPASDGTAVLNFVVLDGQQGYQSLPRD